MGFELFGTFIPYYGFCIAIGIVCASILGYFLCKKTSSNIDDFIIIAAYMGIFGFLGAKILYILVSLKSINIKLAFSSLENFNLLMNSGFVFYGGLLGGLLALPFVKKVHKIDPAPHLKCFAPCLGIAHCCGRIGCSLAGCCYGVQTRLAFHFTYKKSIIAPNGVSLFPVQGIEAALIFVLTVACIILVLKKSKIRVELLYLFTYSIIRFTLEFFRGDAERGKLFFLSTSQIISILILIAVIVIYIKSTLKHKGENHE